MRCATHCAASNAGTLRVEAVALVCRAIRERRSILARSGAFWRVASTQHCTAGRLGPSLTGGGVRVMRTAPIARWPGPLWGFVFAYNRRLKWNYRN